MTHRFESRAAPRFSLKRIDRWAVVTATSGMDNVVGRAAERYSTGAIDQVKGQWRVHIKRWMQ
jgi:hypothetical protein